MKVKSPLTPTYYLFIDESGVANLNDLSPHFVLSTVVINRDDFRIIEGYLRLFKRRYFNDDYKVLHATDICERPYSKYRRLIKPKNVYHAFFEDFGNIIRNIPIQSRIYHVEKQKVCKKYKYIPAKGRKPKNIDSEHPYEISAIEAIKDYAQFLQSMKATGEIVVEARLKSDAKFISYFDDCRTAHAIGRPFNPDYKLIKDSIPSVFFCNKYAGNNGIELADMIAYFASRKINGDPKNKLKVPPHIMEKTYNTIKKCTFDGASFIKKPKL
ncbi:MAG TPA: DUF3800 domain-containing protein [Candidatus Saccharimonadales bacterium]|nr:DUF3800 domain-containing protein [Candidatus Saccharimonadales bacterium]